MTRQSFVTKPDSALGLVIKKRRVTQESCSPQKSPLKEPLSLNFNGIFINENLSSAFKSIGMIKGSDYGGSADEAQSETGGADPI